MGGQIQNHELSVALFPPGSSLVFSGPAMSDYSWVLHLRLYEYSVKGSRHKLAMEQVMYHTHVHLV